MSEERPSQVLGSLPKSRPHRRSDKRGKPAPAGKRSSARSKSMRQPPQPRGTPAQGGKRRAATTVAPPQPERSVLGTAVQAAAELTEIGLSLSARVMRGAISRLPRP